MNAVTGPISIGIGGGFRRRRPEAQSGTNAVAAAGSGADTNLVAQTSAVAGTSSAGATNSPAGTNAMAGEAESPRPPGIVRNISFSGIRATVVVPFPLPEAGFGSNYNPGEIKSCIGLNAVGSSILENISFNNVHITFAGGGTAAEAALRDVPMVVGEYYAAGVFPAYGLFARNVRGLTLQDVRFEVSSPELRPAIVFDHVQDAALNGFSAQGNKDAESLLRFLESKDVLLTASRVLTPSAVFLNVEGHGSEGIKVDGGDLSKAASPLKLTKDAPSRAVKLRA
jgi:hypothetical protein